MSMMGVKYAGVKAPKKAHLAIMHGDTGMWDGIPVGTKIAIIEDPTRSDGIIPLILVGVSKKHLDFLAYSSDGSSKRHVRFTANWSGEHTSPTAKAEKR